VIAGDELVPKDARLPDAATIEIRPVMSGGATDRAGRAWSHRAWSHRA
jgi:hypothetical protein